MTSYSRLRLFVGNYEALPAQGRTAPFAATLARSPASRKLIQPAPSSRVPQITARARPARFNRSNNPVTGCGKARHDVIEPRLPPSLFLFGGGNFLCEPSHRIKLIPCDSIHSIPKGQPPRLNPDAANARAFFLSVVTIVLALIVPAR
jgi:hypothetical protein